ncbi:hypothetical protein FLA_2653 [Filimonas lacunae]|nr:hypothetical protein FLA_2653 [Filimonas lacunae]
MQLLSAGKQFTPVAQRTVRQGGQRQTYEAVQEWYSQQPDTLFQTCPAKMLEKVLTANAGIINLEDFEGRDNAGTLFLETITERYKILTGQEQLNQVSHGVLGNVDHIRRILSFMPITTLANVRGVNHFLKRLVDSQLVFSLKFYDRNYTVNVKFADINNYLKPYRLHGFHGTSKADAPSLYSGLKERKEESEKVYKTSQLGPGFYLTEGTGDTERVYSDTVASERRKMTATSSMIMRVFINVEEESPSFEVPEEMWADMEKNTIPPALTDLCKTPQLLTSAIVKNEHIRQIKVNPALFKLVRVLPPKGMLDSEFQSWITSMLMANPFEFGNVVYD